jgi:hypothetical protein
MIDDPPIHSFIRKRSVGLVSVLDLCARGANRVYVLINFFSLE